MVKASNLQVMPKVTFELSPELKRLMDAHPEVNWSAVFRRAVENQAKAADVARRIVEEMEDPRIQEIAARVKRGVGRRFDQAVRARRH